MSEWKDFVLETLRSESPRLDSPESKFSMRKFILAKAEGRDIAGAEREVIHAESQKEHGRNAPTGTLIPQSVFKQKRSQRDLTVGTDTAGGYTVDDRLYDLITPLDPNLQMLSRVSKVYPTRPYSAPKKDTPAKAFWTGETQAPTEQNPTFSKIDQTPHNLVGWTSFSKELLLTASPDVENLIRHDLRMALAIGAEKAILKASGTGNDPKGLENNSDITTITRSSAGAVTLDQCLEAEESVLSSNAIILQNSRLVSGENEILNNRLRRTQLTWIVSPKMRRLLKKSPSLGTGTSASLWDRGDVGNSSVTIHGTGSTRQPTVIEHPAYVSTFASPNDAWLGNWSEIVFSYFSSPDVIVDPFSLSTSGMVRVTVSQFVDFFIQHSQSVVRLTA